MCHLLPLGFGFFFFDVCVFFFLHRISIKKNVVATVYQKFRIETGFDSSTPSLREADHSL